MSTAEIKELLKGGLMKPPAKKAVRTVREITNEMLCNWMVKEYYPENLN